MSKTVFATVQSGPTYAYTHPKVLRRRRDVRLKAVGASGIMPLEYLSENRPSTVSRMHVVGGPFIWSQRLVVVFRFVRYGNGNSKPSVCNEKLADNIELFSESVLFFDAPSTTKSLLEQNKTIGVEIRVANDARNFSNTLTLMYGDRNANIVSTNDPIEDGTDMKGTKNRSTVTGLNPNVWHVPVAMALDNLAETNRTGADSINFLVETDSSRVENISEDEGNILSEDPFLTSKELDAYDNSTEVDQGDDSFLNWNEVECTHGFESTVLGSRDRSL